MTRADIQTIKQRYGIIGTNDNLNRAIEVALTVARTDMSVLVTGENGSGKEVFARIVHDASVRKHNAFLSLNCGAIPEGTIASELFGHEKGAFTDARAERKGYFEMADGGTLFLDEVGELPLSTQAQLLRVLETGEFIRVGSSKVLKTNVRVVAATNINMLRAVEDGRFRVDLYYRLRGVEIHVPALRERREDIPLLFRKFASDFAERYRMPQPVRLTPEATKMLQDYSWSGNVRELKHVAEQVSLLEEHTDIVPAVLQRYLPNEHLGSSEQVRAHISNERTYEQEREMLVKMILDLRQDVTTLQQEVSRLAGKSPYVPSPAYKPTAAINSLPAHKSEPADEYVEAVPSTVEDIEREAIRRALERNGGNRKAAAAEVGISERTLYRKIDAYGL